MTGRKALKITCDPAAAAEAMDTIGQRHEALMGHVWMAIRSGIDAHDKHEQGHGFPRATPAEFEKAFAALIVDLIGFDGLEPFLELVRLAAEPDFYEML